MIKKTQTRHVIPNTPGIYFFKDRNGKIIYIGKAQNLKMRLASYFREEFDARKRTMLQEAASLDWQELKSNIEALIREAELIKKHRPKYNVVMRDDKRYFYVGFTKSEFPKLFLTHQPFDSVLRTSLRANPIYYIGPFTDGRAIKTTLRSIRRIFPYCQCSIYSNVRHQRPCEEAELGRCFGICCVKKENYKKFYSDIPERQRTYHKNINRIKKILSGHHQTVASMLEKEMSIRAKHQHYEHAARIRDQLNALKNIFHHRPFLNRDDASYAHKGIRYLQTYLGVKTIRRMEAFDISNFQGASAVGSMVVFTDGKPDKNEYRKFRIKLAGKPNDVAMIKEVLRRRFTHDEWTKPDVILIDGGKPQLNTALSINRGRKIKVIALAKREEELYLPGGKMIKLKESPESLLHLLQAIRNEAHRFAISYHKNLRSKALFK